MTSQAEVDCQLIVLCGPSGVGKTTLRHMLTEGLQEEFDYEVVSLDDIREKVFRVEYSKEANFATWQIGKSSLFVALQTMPLVIYDATNLTKQYRKSVVQIADAARRASNCKIHIIAKYITTPYDACIKRQILRARKVPPEHIANQHKRYVHPSLAEGFYTCQQLDENYNIVDTQVNENDDGGVFYEK